jgi:hypothetical protein
MVEAGQLRMWKKRADGGQFYNQADGKLCFVTQRFETGADERGRKRPSTFTVLQASPDGDGMENPWFYETELEEHTVLVE